MKDLVLISVSVFLMNCQFALCQIAKSSPKIISGFRSTQKGQYNDDPDEEQSLSTASIDDSYNWTDPFLLNTEYDVESTDTSKPFPIKIFGEAVDIPYAKFAQRSQSGTNILGRSFEDSAVDDTRAFVYMHTPPPDSEDSREHESSTSISVTEPKSEENTSMDDSTQRTKSLRTSSQTHPVRDTEDEQERARTPNKASYVISADKFEVSSSGPAYPASFSADSTIKCRMSRVSFLGCDMEVFHIEELPFFYFGLAVMTSELTDRVCPCPIPRIDPSCSRTAQRLTRYMEHICYSFLKL